MKKDDTATRFKGFWVGGSLYAARDGDGAMELAKQREPANHYSFRDIKIASPEDLEVVVPVVGLSDGDQFRTFGEIISARTEPGCLVFGE